MARRLLSQFSLVMALQEKTEYDEAESSQRDSPKKKKTKLAHDSSGVEDTR